MDAFINHVRNTEWYEDQIVHWQRIPGRERVEGKLRSPLSSNTIRALEEDGINSLFYHQAEAINLLASGSNVMVATSASSGKTLCYNIPVVETLSKNSLARAMYIFPTKFGTIYSTGTLPQLKDPTLGETAEFSSPIQTCFIWVFYPTINLGTPSCENWSM